MLANALSTLNRLGPVLLSDSVKFKPARSVGERYSFLFPLFSVPFFGFFLLLSFFLFLLTIHEDPLVAMAQL